MFNLIMILIFGKLLRTFSLAVTLALMGACAGGAVPEEQPLVVVTTSIWGDVVKEIVGDSATVEVLMPVGTDAHEFQASAAQAALAHRADLVVANGLGLEEGMEDVLEEVAAAGVPLFEAGDHVETRPLSGGDEGGGPDPHIWMDPVRVASAAVALGEALDAAVPGHGFADAADDYASRMDDLYTDMARALEAVPESGRVLVTNHEALGYFADRFDFRIAGVVIPGGSTLANPSPADLAELVATIEAEQVPAIFAETSSPAALAETVAAEVGGDIEVIELYTESLGPPGSGADTLAGMLLTDARLVAAGLG
jgi:zinc/manganese transport system substrate-binding protein